MKMCSPFVNIFVISVWTLVQSIFHIVWSVYGYASYYCYFLPSQYNLVLVHLTYFYRQTCGKIHLDSYQVFRPKDLAGNDSSILYDFLVDVLARASLPEQSPESSRTNFYFLLFFIVDCLWMVSAVILFVGNYYDYKNNFVLVVYGPWIAVTIVVCTLDLIASLHFGFDARFTDSFTSWLKFIGVKNYRDFSTYDQLEEGLNFELLVPSLAISFLASRFLLFWVSNVIFLYMMFNTLLRHFQSKNPISSQHHRSVNADITRNFNDSEARIRQWQLFYGSVETTRPQEEDIVQIRDYNSNSRQNRNFKTQYTQTMSLEEFNNDHNSSEDKSANTSSYFQYSDVAEPVPMPLSNHVPWSYVHGPSKDLHVKYLKNDESVTNL